MAAQESLILGDLNSPLYFTKSDHPDDGNQASEGREDCILPWCLRLLATRLQALAANDMRRCIQGLYDLAADARTGYQCSTSADSKSLWQGRLKDLGLRIGNALLEMGDLHGAKRLFESLIASTMAEVESSISPAKALVHAEEEEKAILAGWVAMLSLRMGDLEEARNWIDVGVAGSSGSAEQRSKRGVLDALYEMAEGKYDDAVTCWRALLEGPDHILAAHNLAACLVYTGHLSEASQLLEDMVDQGHAFHALTFNLATVYELRTEGAKERKMKMAERVAEGLRRREDEDGTSKERSNRDFKC